MKNFKILPATENDIPIIFKFIKKLAEYHGSSADLVATEEILRDSLFVKKYAEIILGYLDKQPVAYALFLHNFSTLLGKPGLYLVDLYVAPEARNQGIGKNIMLYLAKLAKKRGYARFEWTVLKSNSEAISLYKGIEAKIMDEWIIFRMNEEAINQLIKN